jgi:hypothetical protein
MDLKGRKLKEHAEDCIMKPFLIYSHHQIILGYQIKEDEMGGACGMHGVEKHIQNFGQKS